MVVCPEWPLVVATDLVGTISNLNSRGDHDIWSILATKRTEIHLMPRPGESLEQLVSSLEKALGTSEKVFVESPKRLRDRITGKLREHDIVLTIKQSHHEAIVAIECRDRSRPVAVDQVESFWRKCQDTDVSCGIIVSASGFYKTARQKAGVLGIRCLGIEEAKSFDWMLTGGMSVLVKQLLQHKWTFHPESQGVADDTNMEIVREDGRVLTQEDLVSNALAQLEKHLPNVQIPTEEQVLLVKFPGDGLRIRNRDSGETTSVLFAIAKLQYRVANEFIPFELVQYRDGEETITEAAVAELEYGSVSGKIVIIGNSDAAKNVVFVPGERKGK